MLPYLICPLVWSPCLVPLFALICYLWSLSPYLIIPPATPFLPQHNARNQFTQKANS